MGNAGLVKARTAIFFEDLKGKFTNLCTTFRCRFTMFISLLRMTFPSLSPRDDHLKAVTGEKPLSAASGPHPPDAALLTQVTGTLCRRCQWAGP
jgi:hypothetical protein